MPINPSRNPRYTWSIIAIIVAVVVISVFSAILYHVNRPAPRQDTGFVVAPAPDAQSKAAQPKATH